MYITMLKTWGGEIGFIYSKKVICTISDLSASDCKELDGGGCYMVGGEGESWTEDMNFKQFPEWIRYCISPPNSP